MELVCFGYGFNFGEILLWWILYLLEDFINGWYYYNVIFVLFFYDYLRIIYKVMDLYYNDVFIDMF